MLVLKLAVYLRNYKKECILGPAFKFLEVILELLLPTIMALIINRGVAQRDGNYVLTMGAWMVLLACCGYGSAFICQRFASRASQGFGTALRNAVFRRALAFSSAQIDRFGAATLTTRLTNDVNQLQQWVAMMIRLVSRAPFICLGSILMAFLLDTRLALILLAATPVLALIIYVITRNAAPLYRAYQGKLDRLAALLGENLSGVRVIRAFSKNQEQARRFAQANGDLMDSGLAIGRISSFFNPLTSLVVNLVIVLLLWVGGGHINAGRLSQGQIIAFINYVSQILAALLVLSNLIILLTKSMASAARINEVLDLTPDMTDTAGAAPAPVVAAPAIEFQDVCFGYNRTGEQALEHITLAIGAGQTIGIIGGTGSGKSTLVGLIARLYDATGGCVRVDGIPVQEYPLQALRTKIALVPQRATLFAATVAQNIRWGNPQATDDDVRAAAAMAQADGFIAELPQGYDTPVQRGGSNLSGGQRQRLTIARALAADPAILILDDATSALDYVTDARLRRALRAQHGQRTVLLVSQRVSVVRDADAILVLEDAEMAGFGPHDALLQSCPAYQQICQSQLAAEEVAP